MTLPQGGRALLIRLSALGDVLFALETLASLKRETTCGALLRRPDVGHGDLTALEKLDRMQYLHLAHNRVVDLEPIGGLKNLRSLYLSHNKLKDLSPIAGLDKVWSLYVDGNRITSLEPLSKMKWLSSLDLRGNQVKNLKPLNTLTELKYLVIEKNQISDVSPLLEMAKKDAEGEQRFAPFWRLYVANNPLSDESKEHLDKIKKLGGRVTEDAIPE